MDFGDILDEWDRQTAQPQGKKGKKGEKKKTGETGEKRKSEKPEEKKTGYAKERPAPAKAADLQKPEQVHPLTAWLRIHEVYDKDSEDGEAESSGERRRRLFHKRADAAIDLHGLTQHEAWGALESFFQDSRRQGFEKLHIIHGKGNHSAGEAVLKQTVKQFIERCPFAGESGHGNAASGGTGATWVLLKKAEMRR